MRSILALKPGKSRALGDGDAGCVAGAPEEERRTQAASLCHSGSACAFQNLPPACAGSPPACCASGWSRRRLLSGSLGLTNWETNSKFCRDCSFVQEESPGKKGCNRRRGVSVEWQSNQRTPPSHSLRKPPPH